MHDRSATQAATSWSNRFPRAARIGSVPRRRRDRLSCSANRPETAAQAVRRATPTDRSWSKNRSPCLRRRCTCGNAAATGTCSGPFTYAIGVGACTDQHLFDPFERNVRPDRGRVRRDDGPCGRADAGRARMPRNAADRTPRSCQDHPGGCVSAAGTPQGCSDGRVCVKFPGGKRFSLPAFGAHRRTMPRRVSKPKLGRRRSRGLAWLRAVRMRDTKSLRDELRRQHELELRHRTSSVVGRRRLPKINPGFADQYVRAVGTSTLRSDPCVVTTASAPTGDLNLVRARVLCCR